MSPAKAICPSVPQKCKGSRYCSILLITQEVPIPPPAPQSLTFTSHGTVHRMSNLGSQRIDRPTPKPCCAGKNCDDLSMWSRKAFLTSEVSRVPHCLALVPSCASGAGTSWRSPGCHGCAVVGHVLELSITSLSSSALP